MKKTATESHRILVEVYGEHALAQRTCQKWFALFKSGDFGLEDEERYGQAKKFEDEELEALLNEDCETRPTRQINGKAEYPWREGNALYLVGSEGCAVL